MILSSKKSPNVSHLQVLKPVLFCNGRLSEQVHLLADRGNFLRASCCFNVYDLQSQLCYVTLVVAKERPEKFRPGRDSNPDICDAGAVLNQLRYQAS